MSEGEARRGPARSAPTSRRDDARALLRAWLDAVELAHSDAATCWRCCRTTTSATPTSSAARGAPRAQARPRGRRHRRGRRHARRGRPRRGRHAALRRLRRGDPLRARRRVPRPREGQARRAARASRCASRWSPTASAGCTASRTRSTRCASAACPGFEVEVVGTDANVDRRLSAVAEVDIPFYAGLQGRRAEPAGDRRGAGRGPLRPRSPLLARAGRRRRAADRARHGPAGARQLPHRAGRLRGPALGRPGARGRRRRPRWPPSTAQCDGRALAQRGQRRGAAARWASPPSASVAGTAASTSRASRPTAACASAFGGRDQRALRRPPDPREGRRPAGRRVPRRPRARPAPAPRAWPAAAPRRTLLRARLGEHATFLGWLEGDALADAYASADLFLFASRTDTFGQVLLEAQASGLPVVAVAEGGPCSIVADGVTGLLWPADADGAGRRGASTLAGDPDARARLARRGARGGARAHLGARAGAAGRRLPPGAGRRGRAREARRVA